MTYLQKLIQRLSSKAPANMLLPLANGWNGVNDPFENTQYLPPVYPQSNKKQITTHSEVEPPLPAPPAKQTPIAKEQPSMRASHPVSETSSGEPCAPNKSSDIVVQRKRPTTMNSPFTAKHNAPVESQPSAQPQQSTDNKDIPEPQHNHLSARQQPKVTQWETRWLRRHVSDTATAVESKKIEPLRKSAPEQQIRWLSPRQGLVSVRHQSASTPVIHPVPKPREPRAWKRRQPQQPRLVIGQLTVDVVPVKPAKAPQRRKAAGKKRGDAMGGKFAQVESARFAFGIGQM